MAAQLTEYISAVRYPGAANPTTCALAVWCITLLLPSTPLQVLLCLHISLCVLHGGALLLLELHPVCNVGTAVCTSLLLPAAIIAPAVLLCVPPQHHGPAACCCTVYCTPAKCCDAVLQHDGTVRCTATAFTAPAGAAACTARAPWLRSRVH
jgi:hypothetical protein